MKRKLDGEDRPVPAAPSVEAAIEQRRTLGAGSFAAFNLDNRLLQAIAKQNMRAPTPVQAQMIPIVAAGKSILARSKTGTGKTAAYLLPILQSILAKSHNSARACVAALILLPTKELASQVSKNVTSFIAFCGQSIRTVNLAQQLPEAVHFSQLAELPDIVVSTPARALKALQQQQIPEAKSIQFIVLDEADLMTSYGYEDDLRQIGSILAAQQSSSQAMQTLVVSATLPMDEMTVVKEAFFAQQEPIVLDIKTSDDEHPTKGQLAQYVVRCAEDEKFLLVYVVFKLKLIKGKCIIFVGNVNRSYRVKLFLEQFGIRSCVLNSELPANSRIHVVEEFNKNVYDIIIASDEHEIIGDDGDASKTGLDKEYGISRGIDFRNVACVLNFDFPTSAESYIHRIGRTARAGKSGMVLSLIIPRTEYRKDKATSLASTKHDETILAEVQAEQRDADSATSIQPYHFDMDQVNAFRYRMNDALRAVTGAVVRETRVREIRQELLKSEKLKRHFEEHPDDLKALRHDNESRTVRTQPHLKHVPDYLMPNTGAKGLVRGRKVAKGRDEVEDDEYHGLGFVGQHKRDKRTKGRRGLKRGTRPALGSKKKERPRDPLKTFRAA